MPLDGYGVLVGTLTTHVRDTPDTQGRWFHVNLELTAPAGRYRCAVDVDSKQSETGVEWRVLRVPPVSLGAAVAALPPGYHDLRMSPESGAIDYLRHPALRVRPGCAVPAVERLLGWLGERVAAAGSWRAGSWRAGSWRAGSWRAGSNLDAAEALEGILQVGTRTLVFGEPFETGLGMHNIHQNQGDPAGSQWWDENGTWQDGATVVVRPDESLDVFLSKFSTQAYRTDDDGHPV
jgi:hypothetical protein